ncbi:MAG TPA: exopolyphosphatase, partial [Candidatus Nitrosotenuis sp.]|nr:exopolyphosphatase [Candidatus Nitrosotenuis sp.]
MRLLTRSDFDGLACAVLLQEMGLVDEMKFVHPKDLQDGKVEVNKNDILANVPYVEGCGLWFDHHTSELDRGSLNKNFEGESRPAPSAARVIWEYYGGEDRFRPELNQLLGAVDKADSAQFTAEEILNPTGWVLLSFVMDPRTGLGRYKDYRISNYQLMEDLIGYCRTMTIDQILEQPDVKERVNRYLEHRPLFEQMVKENTEIHGNVIVTDLRGVDPIYCGNRFLIYALYPEQNASIWIVSGKQNQNCVFALGKSILNRTCRTNIGTLCRQFGGGGHEASGTCQVPH